MTRLAPHLVAVLALVAALAAGLWFWAAVVAPGYRSAIALGVAWCVLVAVVAGRVGRRQPRVRSTLRVASVACSAALAAAFAWTSIRETTVDEVVVRGAPASSLSPQEREDALGADPLAPQP